METTHSGCAWGSAGRTTMFALGTAARYQNGPPDPQAPQGRAPLQMVPDSNGFSARSWVDSLYGRFKDPEL